MQSGDAKDPRPQKQRAFTLLLTIKLTRKVYNGKLDLIAVHNFLYKLLFSVVNHEKHVPYASRWKSTRVCRTGEMKRSEKCSRQRNDKSRPRGVEKAVLQETPRGCRDWENRLCEINRAATFRGLVSANVSTLQILTQPCNEPPRILKTKDVIMANDSNYSPMLFLAPRFNP